MYHGDMPIGKPKADPFAHLSNLTKSAFAVASAARQLQGKDVINAEPIIVNKSTKQAGDITGPIEDWPVPPTGVSSSTVNHVVDNVGIIVPVPDKKEY